MIDFIRPPDETRAAYEQCDLVLPAAWCCGEADQPQEYEVTISGVGVETSDCPHFRLLPAILGAVGEWLGPLNGPVKLTITIKP